MMKRLFTILGCAMLAAGACTEDKFSYNNADGDGILSFDGFTVLYSEDVNVVTKAGNAEEADESYMLFVYDSEGSKVWENNYGTLHSGSAVSLPAGDYTLVIRSTSADVPVAKFDSPVFGASRAFSISAGETTSIGAVTCTLLQCAASVRYTPSFLAMVTGDGSATVEVASGYPLEYALNYNSGSPKYEMRAGYFAMNNEESGTMSITFRGYVDGKSQKMTAAVSNVKARDWHIITFMKKIDENGNADFSVVIDDLVVDAVLDSDARGVEEGDGNDPNAPSGDGGIELVSTSGYDITKDITVPRSGSFNLTMKALIPNGTRRFTVDISSTNEDFINSVNSVGGTTLDLINPSEAALGVFDIVPFPHGRELLNETEIFFDLADAQTPLLAFTGTHTFTMNVTDNKGCRKSIDLVLVVE